MLQIATDPNPGFGVITQVPWKCLARQAVRALNKPDPGCGSLVL
jgi:hypothetical protein